MIRKPAAVVFITALAVLALVVLPAALAAKGGNGGGGNPDKGPGGGGGGGTPSATLESACNPTCAVGSIGSFWGSNYDASQGVAQLYVSGTWTNVAVSPEGTVSFGWYMSAAGQYDVRLYQNGTGRKMTLKAQLTVTAR